MTSIQPKVLQDYLHYQDGAEDDKPRRRSQKGRNGVGTWGMKGFFGTVILWLSFVRPSESFFVQDPQITKAPSCRYLHSSSSSSTLNSISLDLDDASTTTTPSPTTTTTTIVDRRPHEQRTKGPRWARRLNHGFRYLYRHGTEEYQNMTSVEYLQQFYTSPEIVNMAERFPPLLNLSVTRHLHPKTRFLQETMGLDIFSTDVMKQIPPQYFGARLERILAPRHAFLVYFHLPHGKTLLEDPQRWMDFMISCRTTKRFSALCNQWRNQYQHQHHSNTHQQQQQQPSHLLLHERITSQQIEAFDTMFGRGILAAARDDICQVGNQWPLQHVNITSAELIQLNIQHGANPLERDNRGGTLLHWAAGTGNLEAIKVLLPYFPKGILEVTERDGATPLHWATAGANSKEFGTGGHTDVCRYLLAQCNEPGSTVTTKQLVNQVTKDGNSPLMWASWSGTVETVKLMVRTRADVNIANRNGCTVAHWAASGGNLEICQYLADVVGVDFFIPNYGGNTPLTHAVAFGRIDVVQWLKECMTKKNMGGEEEDVAAATLAEHFSIWLDGDETRKKILNLFQDENYWGDDDTPDMNGNEDDDDDEYV